MSSKFKAKDFEAIDVGTALKLIRKTYNLTIAELSTELNIAQGYLSEVENNKKQPTIELIKKYSDFFHIRISSIFYLAEEIACKVKRKTNKIISNKILSILQIVKLQGDLKNE